MTSHVAAVLLSIAAAATSCAQQESPAPAPKPAALATRPRLVVLCSVDQLASWVFEQGKPHFAADGGFSRLLRDGATFAKCEYEHACTETGPGHATIGTGVAARVHGIVRNQWWVPSRSKTTYCVDEVVAALADLPEGKNRGAGLLLAPTLATALKAGVPGSLAGSVSWKDRSAILMAGPKADQVVWCEAGTGRFVTNSAWATQTPAWLVDFNAQKPLDALFGTEWHRFAPEAAYAGLVDDHQFPHGNGQGQRTLPQLLTGAGKQPGTAFYTQVYLSPFGNTIVRMAAEAMVRGMQLGADATTDLLCVSFSSTDAVGHAFGPDSVESRDALLRLDRELATFLTFLDTQVGQGQWAMFVTADHGVGATPEWAQAQGIDAGRGVILTKVGAAAEAALAATLGAPPAGKRFVTHIGRYSVFFNDAVLDSVRGARELAEVRLQAARLVAEAACKVRGVATAFATADLLADGGAPDPLRRSLVDALCPGRAGEVQVVIKPHWLDGTTPASHGTPHAYDREVVGLAFGRGVPAGATMPATISPGFGAVWFAQMLGLPRPAQANDQVPASFGAPW